MKVVIEFYVPVFPEIQETIKSWKEEHEGYYGKYPTKMPNAKWMRGERPEAGYTAWVTHAGDWEDWEGESPTARKLWAVQHHRWLTAGGNETIVSKLSSTYTVEVTGRRHGVRWPIDTAGLTVDEDRYIIRGGDLIGRVLWYSTQAPDSLPWEYGVTPSN